LIRDWLSKAGYKKTLDERERPDSQLQDRLTFQRTLIDETSRRLCYRLRALDGTEALGLPRPRMTYARAGVDVSQVRKSHEALARRSNLHSRPAKEKVGHPVFPIGHYAGLVDLNDGRVLSLHTDSVGNEGHHCPDDGEV